MAVSNPSNESRVTRAVLMGGWKKWVPVDRGSRARPTLLLSGAENRGRASRLWLK